jgi:biotin carboxyl carrier protein
MKYFVKVGTRDQPFEVDVSGGKVVVDGVELEAHLAAVPGTPLHHLLLAGGSWTVAAQPLEGAVPMRWALGAVGERFEVEVVDERTRQIQALTGTKRRPAGGGTLRAPMPGLVVRIAVEPGQAVEAGMGIVVIEAMKMENELRTSQAGVVGAVHVKVGQAVEKGAALVSVEVPEPQG